MAKKTIALGLLVRTIDLHEAIKDEMARVLPGRIATVWQEQNPQEAIPRAVDGVPATLTIDVGVDVVMAIVEDVAIAIARKLEGFPIDKERLPR